MISTKLSSADKRKLRVRNAIRRTANSKLRLSVHRTNQHIYAQVIDDAQSRTLASASTSEKELKGKVGNASSSGAAQKVGELIAQRAMKAGVKDVVFDRGQFLYHGRVKALAEGARSKGLKF